MKRSLSRAILGAVAAGALVAGTLVATPAEARPGKNSEPGPVSVPQRYLEQQVDWQPCSFDETVKQLHPGAPTTNCAMVTVPMDWSHPDDHPDIQIAVALSEATGSSRGLMMTNPGGPGGAGLTMSAALAISKPQLFSDYDLLGFDPRGFGQSTRLRCPIDADDLAAIPVTPDYRERTELTHQVEVAEAKAYAEACAATEFSEFVSTQQTVYDMDFLRALLDHSTVNYIGYSYGTWLGTWYADTYPDRVDRFVLDSNMNWVDDMQANADSDSSSFQRRRDDMLFPWIARHSETYGLGTTAKAVEQRYEEIRAKLVANTKAGIDTPYGYELDLAVLNPIYTDSGFLEAAEAIVAMGEMAFDEKVSTSAQRRVAAATDDRALSPSALLADARDRVAAGDEVIDLGSIGTVVRCNDTPYQTNPQPYLARADRDAAKYSYIGYFNTVPMCAFWPYEQQPRRIDLDNVPMMLMIQSEGDPATATEGAVLSHRLTRKHTVMVGVPEEGQHGIYIGGPSPCIEQIGDAFVFGGALPSDLTMCATTALPGDSDVFPLAGPFDKFQRRDRHTSPKRANPMLVKARAQASPGTF